MEERAGWKGSVALDFAESRLSTTGICGNILLAFSDTEHRHYSIMS